jgi:hypothetical protein
MRLEPRREILDIWREVTRYSFRDGAFVWAGGSEARDSVSDAEQLLCVLLPATELPALRFDRPDETADDVGEALSLIGDVITLPRRLVRSLTEYMTRYADDDGPTFPGGRYLVTADPQMSTLDVLESYALGVRLSLAALGFARVYRTALRREELIEETVGLEELASRRLTCAMVGLLRCFAIHGFHDDSRYGENLRRTITQEHREQRAVLQEYEASLAEVRAGLHEITIATRDVPEARIIPGMRFECGWSWALVEGTAPVDVDDQPVPDRTAVAAALPDPYFSFLAHDAVTSLYSERTRILALLSEEQQRIARALQLRVDLTRAYWARLATFGDQRWPVERMPWRTTSGQESDHHSLAMAAITAAAVGDRRGNTDVAFSHLTRTFAQLARRQGIVRPPRTAGPGSLAPQRVPLPFEKDGHVAAYQVTSLAPLLFNTTIRAGRATHHSQLRGDLDELADLIWNHVARGDIDPPPTGLRRFGDGTAPDWHNVFCLVDGLTRAMATATEGPALAESPLGFVHQLLTAADEMLDPLDPKDRAAYAPETDRARALIDHQPARAAALLYRILADLDALTADQTPPAPQP